MPFCSVLGYMYFLNVSLKMQNTCIDDIDSSLFNDIPLCKPPLQGCSIQGNTNIFMVYNCINNFFHFSLGSRPLMSSKGNQIPSSSSTLPCERKVLFSKASECESCWKLSSWHRNKTKLECGYCCGDA